MESDKPRTNAGFGPLKDLHNLQQNGSASLGELKEFLNKLQGRSPQEVVGLVSTSMLVQSMVISTLGTLAILVVFTVGPYLVYGPPKPSKEQVAKTVLQEMKNRAAETPAKPTEEPAVDDKTKAVQKMGIDETKTSDPNKNPLDKVDNLLEGLK